MIFIIGMMSIVLDINRSVVREFCFVVGVLLIWVMVLKV